MSEEDYTQKPYAADRPIARLRSLTMRTPPEVWRIVFNFLVGPSDPNAPSDLASVTRVCLVFRAEGEAVLYRHVTVGPSSRQIRKFLETVGGDRRLASTMRSLHLDIPDVAYGAPQLPAVVRSLVGDMARNYRVAPVDAAKIQYLRAPMEKMFRYAVNLVDLDFPALEDFPGVLSAATFRLRVLSTTGTGFGVLHAWENWPVLNSDFDRFCLYTPLRKLRTLRTLDLDLKGIWCSARSLYPAFSQYHITHLTLRGAADRSLAHDLLPIVGDRLVSFRLILASRDDTFEPSMDLWPTQILGDARLPLLKYLELDEFAHVYHSCPLQPPFVPFDDEPWCAACPAIETFVWRPSAHHFRLFGLEPPEGPCFQDALLAFHAALFAGWRTLERFERSNLDEKLGGSDKWVTCTRARKALLVGEVVERNEDLWRKV